MENPYLKSCFFIVLEQPLGASGASPRTIFSSTAFNDNLDGSGAIYIEFTLHDW